MIDPDRIDWAKMEGLVPAIVQDRAGVVRMLGYMNREALVATLDSVFVTFFSRSRQRLWMKGETSGNRLALVAIRSDCDHDTLLVTVDAQGPTCHEGTRSCFGDDPSPFFPAGLEAIVASRVTGDPAQSYTAKLFGQGVKRIAQKVGEEGLEAALAATAGDRDELVAEAADLAFHLSVLLAACGKSWSDVAAELERRHSDRSATASS